MENCSKCSTLNLLFNRISLNYERYRVEITDYLMRKDTMAKAVKAKSVKKQKVNDVFPFERENYIIIGIGILFIILGYVALSGNSVDGFSQLMLAPLLLLAGYCVIIPIGIIYRKKGTSSSSTESAVPHG